ncbi:F-box protein At5g07610-like isoform X5 [Papaver somniferum]|uniref:F-box protein At5g07610-like isoform X5 n=1 Tax=Papaver somniferum TaxID=3469 RepID=UPI000E70538C|nr:F-box protein At5g07610-like isoform X5 [Papaver somniferum]
MVSFVAAVPGQLLVNRDTTSTAPLRSISSSNAVSLLRIYMMRRREDIFIGTRSKLVYSTMPSPPIPADGFDSKKVKCEYFGVCNGHLYFAEVHDSSATRFDILEMDIDYTCWTVKYHVDLQDLAIAYPEMVRARYDFSILLIEEDEVSSNLVISLPDKIISYDLKEMSFKKLHGGARVTAPKYSAYRYDESLACV